MIQANFFQQYKTNLVFPTSWDKFGNALMINYTRMLASMFIPTCREFGGNLSGLSNKNVCWINRFLFVFVYIGFW